MEVSVFRKEVGRVDDEMGRLEVVCKVVCKVVRQALVPVDVYWTVPGLANHELHKDDLTVLLTEKFRIDEVELEQVIVSRLVVEEVDTDDSGLYSCRVGRVVSDIMVTVDNAGEMITINPSLEQTALWSGADNNTNSFMLPIFCMITILNLKML